MSIEIRVVQEIVGRQLGKRGVKPDDDFQADLEVESVDLLSLVGAMEERFGVRASDEEIEALETVRDLYRLFEEKL